MNFKIVANQYQIIAHGKYSAAYKYLCTSYFRCERRDVNPGLSHLGDPHAASGFVLVGLGSWTVTTKAEGTHFYTRRLHWKKALVYFTVYKVPADRIFVPTAL